MRHTDVIAKWFGPADGYPRPRGTRLTERELAPGDVLLSRSSTEVGNAIVAADGGSYSHAALWTGATVIEAALAGTAEHVNEIERDVYRFHVGDEPLPATAADRIVAVAREQMAGGYATCEIYQLAMLLKMGLRPRRSLVNQVLSVLGGPRADHLEQWLAQLGPGVQPRVCTELVAHSFFVASPSREYALRILPFDERPSSVRAAPLDAEESAAFEALSSRCRELLDRQGTETRKLWIGQLALCSKTGRPLGVVSPADLQFSPSLRFIGHLPKPEGVP